MELSGEEKHEAELQELQGRSMLCRLFAALKHAIHSRSDPADEIDKYERDAAEKQKIVCHGRACQKVSRITNHVPSD